MKRTITALGAMLAALLVSGGAAHADPGTPPVDAGCGGGYVAPALSTHLRYATQTWTGTDSGTDSATLGIAAPRGWSFVRTPQGEGRFHSRSGLDLLSLRTPTQAGTPAELMAAQVRELAGTSGLKVTGQYTKVMRSAHQVWSTLGYRYLSSMGEPRTVKVRWIAFGTSSTSDAALVLTVAGRPLDGHGLDALLAHTTPTVELAG
jgi:hypothetical protein